MFSKLLASYYHLYKSSLLYLYVTCTNISIYVDFKSTIFSYFAWHSLIPHVSTPGIGNTSRLFSILQVTKHFQLHHLTESFQECWRHYPPGQMKKWRFRKGKRPALVSLRQQSDRVQSQLPPSPQPRDWLNPSEKRRLLPSNVHFLMT